MTATVTPEEGPVITLKATITDGTMRGTVAGEGFAGEFTGTRTSKPGTGDGDGDDDAEDDKPAEKVEVELASEVCVVQMRSMLADVRAKGEPVKEEGASS